MTDLQIQCFNLDSNDPQRTAGFWQEALGWRRTHDTGDEVVLEPPTGSPQHGVLRAYTQEELERWAADQAAGSESGP